MKALSDHLSPLIANFIATNHQVDLEQFEFQHTRKEFDGDITLVVFLYCVILKQIQLPWAKL